MQKFTLTIIGFFTGLLAFSQVTSKNSIPNIVNQSQVEAHVRFLASDELKGRDTGSPELDIAAQYIASYFQGYGVQPLDSANSYFQPVSLFNESPPTAATLSFQGEEFQLVKDMLLLAGDSLSKESPTVFVNYGMPEDLEGVDLEGKIAVALLGRPGDTNPQSAFFASPQKQAQVAEMGGVALVELYRSAQVPWSLLVRYLNSDQMKVGGDAEEELPIVWLNDGQSTLKGLFEEKSGEIASLNIGSKIRQPVNTKNVVGVLEGTNPDLRNEYVVLSAHYDHIGANPQATGAEDSIYNGARDNALGTTALLSAAKYFSENPPQRSVVFLAFTAEEKGLLGSQYYTKNPLVPMEQIVFNLNTDGAGYNDTTKVTAIGLERTSAQEAIASAAQSVGLAAIGDPVPEQNLYDRSDNVNFAKLGVPSVTFSPGITAFDAEIMKYYHQVTDEVGSLNFSYAEQYCEAFVQAAENIANLKKAPTWQEGDKYEEAGKQLYGR
ncbi:M28 family peptidase [Tunicatimonas pelagia]|uniref:M28 family peptidase n=1 Tax=Tunicatimonas pelagia TaxID=931531 RepID=UPI0026669631|nr:M28 family peptidase [Tunicatimonas pelagia]WKN46232.1 M28 family peptidase [Tunicatimonas pelagia]